MSKRKNRRIVAVSIVALSFVFAALFSVLGASGGIPSTYDGVRMTIPQAIQAAYTGGFHTENNLSSIVEIGLAESTLTTKARNWHLSDFGFRPATDVIGVQPCNQNPAVWNASCTQQAHSDRGWLQISSHFWHQYTDAQVDDPVGAAQAAFTISSNGTNFSLWDTASIAAQYDSTVRPQVKSFLAGSPTTSPTTTTTKPVTTTTTAGGAGEIRFNAYITGYGWPDNNPPNSATISNPIIHNNGADGQGTFADPITVAQNATQFPWGTKFYIPNVRRYFIAEDTIGDAVGQPPHLDLWTGGRDGSSSQSVLACENAITGTGFAVIQNPASNYVVVPGPLTQSGQCTAQYGNTAVTSGGTTTTTGPTTTVATTTAPTTTTQPTTTTTRPPRPTTGQWYQCINALGQVESSRQGILGSSRPVCANTTDRYVTWAIGIVYP